MTRRSRAGPDRNFPNARGLCVMYVPLYRNAWARCECTPGLPFPLIRFYVRCRVHKTLEYVPDVPCSRMVPCDHYLFEPAAFAAATMLFALTLSASNEQYRRLKRAAMRFAAAGNVGTHHLKERCCRTCDICPGPVKAMARYARACFGSGDLRALLAAAGTPVSKRSRWIREERQLTRTPVMCTSTLMLLILPLAIGVCETCYEAEFLMRELSVLKYRYLYSGGKFYREGTPLPLLKGLSSFVSEALLAIANRSAASILVEPD